MDRVYTLDSAIEATFKRYVSMFDTSSYKQCEEYFCLSDKRVIVSEVVERLQSSLLALVERIKPPRLLMTAEDQSHAVQVACLMLRACASECFDTPSDTFTTSEWALAQLALNDMRGTFQINAIKRLRPNGTLAPYTDHRIIQDEYDRIIDFVLTRVVNPQLPYDERYDLVIDVDKGKTYAYNGLDTELPVTEQLEFGRNYRFGSIALLADGYSYRLPLDDCAKHHVWWCLDLCLKLFQDTSLFDIVGALGLQLTTSGSDVLNRYVTRIEQYWTQLSRYADPALFVMDSYSLYMK
ncbi:hypothetical protein [Heliothis virescens ascovirus 3e]|uniref:Uncharacterized protein n=1 Tax=Heliothis virescens ascovirus 3e TaxID=260797 RepID=A4KXL2_HVAVE|nr:hypothetical protein HVAV3e_gp156 [Heliothis virescens ascovirus 3e]ABO37343.1 hypothetical protein [Heliothis virescens ascovirus 3e]